MSFVFSTSKLNIILHSPSTVTLQYPARSPSSRWSRKPGRLTCSGCVATSSRAGRRSRTGVSDRDAQSVVSFREDILAIVTCQPRQQPRTGVADDSCGEGQGSMGAGELPALEI